MIIPPEKIQVIMKVAGEGGGYTILGRKHQSHWQFWRDARDSDEWMHDELGAEAPSSTSNETAAEPAICQFETLEEALEQINSCWPNLHPIQVHPYFSRDIWNRVVRYFQDNNEGQVHRVLSKWREICLVRRLTSLDELNSAS